MKIRNRIIMAIFILIASLNSHSSHAGRAGRGAIIGGGIGVGLGGLLGGGRGALIGGSVGLATGAIAGSAADREAEYDYDGRYYRDNYGYRTYYSNDGDYVYPYNEYVPYD